MPRGSVAIAIVNMRQDGYPRFITLPATKLGLRDEAGYQVTEVFDGGAYGLLRPGQNISCRVNPTGIMLFKAVPLPGYLKYRKMPFTQNKKQNNVYINL